MRLLQLGGRALDAAFCAAATRGALDTLRGLAQAASLEPELETIELEGPIPSSSASGSGAVEAKRVTVAQRQRCREVASRLYETALAAVPVTCGGLAPSDDAFDGSAVDRVLLAEREEVLLAVLRRASSSEHLEGGLTPGTHARGDTLAAHKRRVGVLGEAHLPGLASAWSAPSGGAIDPLPVTPLIPPTPSSSPGASTSPWPLSAAGQALPVAITPIILGPGPGPGLGLGLGHGATRGLLEAFLLVACGEQVAEDARLELGLLGPGGGGGGCITAMASDSVTADVDYQATREVYESPRMQALGALPEALLEAVVSPWPRGLLGGTIARTRTRTLGDDLQVLRGVRPARGGRGWSEEALERLRGMDYEL